MLWGMATNYHSQGAHAWREANYLALHSVFETNRWVPRPKQQYRNLHDFPKKQIMPPQIKVDGVKYNLKDTKKVGRMNILPKPEYRIEDVTSYLYRSKTSSLIFLFPESIITDHWLNNFLQPNSIKLDDPGNEWWNDLPPFIPIFFLRDELPSLVWQKISWRFAVDVFESTRCMAKTRHSSCC